jgi:hypothetical protein
MRKPAAWEAKTRAHPINAKPHNRPKIFRAKQPARTVCGGRSAVVYPRRTDSSKLPFRYAALWLSASAGAWITFIGVADKELFIARRATAKLPFQTRREAGALRALSSRLDGAIPLKNTSRIIIPYDE